MSATENNKESGKEPRTLTRREKERIARSQLIIDAAREVFSFKGFANATLDEIAERAEFGKASLYSYFSTKEDLFGQVVEGTFNEIKQRTIDAFAEGETFEEKVRNLAESLLRYFYNNFESYHLFRNESHNLREKNPMLRFMPDLLNLIVEEISRAQARKEVKKIDPFDLAMMLLDMIYSQTNARVYRRVVKDGVLSTIGNEEKLRALIRKLQTPDEQQENDVAEGTKVVMEVCMRGIVL